MSRASDTVLLTELSTSSGQRFGCATLNSPSTLNSLSLAMVQLLTPALREWAHDPSIAGVVFSAAGDKAFCAGGDLQELYQSMVSCGSGPNPYAHGFFAQEYQLDHLIHTFPKPVMCWAHGIVMGGGMGLMAGASHRVVTAKSHLAMPEISVGLYPDVGGSWILRRMPGRVGLFLGLTGAPLNAADALFCGLADVYVGTASLHDILGAIAVEAWSQQPLDNRAHLSRLLAGHASAVGDSKVRQHFDLINALMAGDDLGDIAHRLRALKTEDPWLLKAVSNFVKGSPTSAALTYELWRRAHHLSLAEVFRLEYRASLGCAAHPDFAEGIRALLIHRDRHPRWTPDRLEDVTPEWIDEHFEARFSSPHPLASLS